MTTKMREKLKTEKILIIVLISISFFQINAINVRIAIIATDIKTPRAPFVGNALITTSKIKSKMLNLNFVERFATSVNENAAIRNALNPVTYEKVPLARTRSRIPGTEFRPPLTA